MDYIFQNFKQIQEDDEHFGGTGLGLAITKQLVELQGGTISVSSILDEGSTFIFEINYKKGILSTLEKSEKKSFESKENFNQEKILVVEDNYMNRKYILTLLKKWNLKFEIAEDGIEAIAMSERQQFDLIFMDISMPRLNGYEATKAIRSDKKNINQNSPIVALSASAFITIKAKAIELGMNDFLCKPFDPQSLRTLISKYIREKPVNPKAKKEHIKLEPKFKHPLNGEHLFALYEGNWTFAIEMFVIFTRDNLSSFYKIRLFLQEDQFEEARKIIHKLITNLSMVGLLDASQMMTRLENLILGQKDKSDMIILHDQLEAHIQEAKPVLYKTIEDFEAYFQQNTITA